MKNFLEFLSSRDRDTLLNSGKASMFADGDRILVSGDKNTALHIIKSGTVSVVSRNMGHEIEIEKLYANDVLGDLSFVDGEPVSADVIAEGPVTIVSVKIPDIENIIRNDPLFYGRFYHAIAKVLSRRIRADNRKAEEYMSSGIS